MTYENLASKYMESQFHDYDILDFCPSRPWSVCDRATSVRDCIAGAGRSNGHRCTGAEAKKDQCPTRVHGDLE